MIIESTTAAHDALDQLVGKSADGSVGHEIYAPRPSVYAGIAHRGRRHWRVPVWRRVWRWVQRRLP